MPQSKMNILVLSDFFGYDANVVRDYLYCFNQHSRHQYYYLHAWSKNQCRRLHGFDFNRFDAIILFWDFYWVGSGEPMSYCYVPDWAAERIADSRALKIQFLQDEYRDVRLANRAMSRFGVNLMFTCVAEKDHELFYPKGLIPSLKATYSVLTGYVPSYLEKVDYPAEIERPIDIGYRSRKLAYYLGRLGQEKATIADRFQEIADRYGFTANISVNEKDRIYGENWLAFMKACRFSIGTESGASVVDFDSQIRKRCQDYVHHHPAASFDEVSKIVFRDVDEKVVVQTISPRLFEAAAFENTLILHEGRYEDMLEPDVHYISVKKDYSNVAEVVERMKDLAFCQKLARNAKEALIRSKRYNYRSFVKKFDAIVEGHVAARSHSSQVSRTMFYVMNYLNNDRLLPHGGVFLIPNTGDVVYHYNKYAPSVMIWWYSLGLILGLVTQAPTMIATMIQNLLFGGKSRASIAGMIRDLRILAMFFRLRAGIRVPRCPALAVSLSYRRDTNQLIATSEACAENPDQSQHAFRRAAELEILDGVLKGEAPVSLSWEHRLTGNAFPLGAPPDCSISLNDDGIYRFDTLNRLKCNLSIVERDLIKQLAFGGWKEPSWFAKCGAFFVLLWTILQYVLIKKPLGYLRPLFNFITSRFAGRASDGNSRDPCLAPPANVPSNQVHYLDGSKP